MATYTPAPYSAENAEDLNNFYTPRIRGEKTGFAPEDLKTMESKAVNSANYSVNESVRRGASSRRTPGGITTGGMGTTRESAVNTALGVRSQALQDIAVQNAVLKHQDQWNAATGMQNFMTQQDSMAMQQYSIQAQMEMYNTQADAMKSAAMWQGIGSMVGGAGSAYGGYASGAGSKALASAIK